MLDTHFLASVVWNTFDMRKKEKIIHILKDLFILLFKKETFKKTQQSTICFLLLFQCNISLCFNALILKASSLAFVHFFYMFFYFSDTLFFFHFVFFFFALVMFFDLFLKGRTDWLSIFIG